MSSASLHAENSKLRKQVGELVLLLRKRDEEISVALETIKKLSKSKANPDFASNAKDKADLLLTKFREYGFSTTSVEHAFYDLESRADAELTPMASLHDEAVLDQLLTSTDACDKTAESQAPGKLTLGLYGDAQNTSFLGKPIKPVPRAQKYGLFGDEGVEVAREGFTDAPTLTTNSTLFGSSAEVKTGADSRAVASVVHEGAPLLYTEFISMLMRPENGDLVKSIKLFIASILGPNGNATPPVKATNQLGYIFYGAASRTADLSKGNHIYSFI